MSLFKRKVKPKNKRKLLRTIQATFPEGSHDYIMIESLLTGQRLNISIPGTTNAYPTYDSQVAETYRKYNALSSFGNQQTRAVVDLRIAFIAGEGISISCENKQTSDWIEDFLNKNLLDGPNFINAVKGAEITGQALFILKESQWLDNTFFIKVARIPYSIKVPYKPVYKDPIVKDEVLEMMIKKDGFWQSSGYKDFIYTRTGGDDANTQGPVTRVGTVLTDIENYDRGIKDMRRNNHIFARITPTFETESASQTKSLKDRLEGSKWQLGEAFIGTAKLKYITPQSGAHENLLTELTSTIKTISSVTGIPVHWLGFVDLMSNRSTAETLYELIKNATILDRQIWQTSIYFLILKAQELYINGGGEGLALNLNFEVRLPLIDFNEFLNRVKGLQIAYMDGAISLGDYRHALPGIDPLKTKRALEKEKAEEENELLKIASNIPEESEEEE